MRNLKFQLRNTQDHNRDGSLATQANRRDMLDLCADQLYQIGFRHMNVDSLKQKHVDALLARWQDEGLSVGTIKNRMSALRWWAAKIGKRT